MNFGTYPALTIVSYNDSRWSINKYFLLNHVMRSALITLFMTMNLNWDELFESSEKSVDINCCSLPKHCRVSAATSLYLHTRPRCHTSGTGRTHCSARPLRRTALQLILNYFVFTGRFILPSSYLCLYFPSLDHV